MRPLAQYYHTVEDGSVGFSQRRTSSLSSLAVRYPLVSSARPALQGLAWITPGIHDWVSCLWTDASVTMLCVVVIPTGGDKCRQTPRSTRITSFRRWNSVPLTKEALHFDESVAVKARIYSETTRNWTEEHTIWFECTANLSLGSIQICSTASTESCIVLITGERAIISCWQVHLLARYCCDYSLFNL